MFPPEIKRLALLGRIQCSVVNAGHARSMSRDVVENGFDHVRLDPKLGQARRNSPADIMQPPRREWLTCSSDAPVKAGSGLTPALKRPVPLAKKKRAVPLPLQRKLSARRTESAFSTPTASRKADGGGSVNYV